MAINRLTKRDYVLLYGCPGPGITHHSSLIEWIPKEIEPCRELTEAQTGARTGTHVHRANVFDEPFETVSRQIAAAFSRQVKDDETAELFRRMESLEEENRNLKREVRTLTVGQKRLQAAFEAKDPLAKIKAAYQIRLEKAQKLRKKYSHPLKRARKILNIPSKKRKEHLSVYKGFEYVSKKV